MFIKPTGEPVCPIEIKIAKQTTIVEDLDDDLDDDGNIINDALSVVVIQNPQR